MQIEFPEHQKIDSLFISQEKSYEMSNAFLFCNYNIISSLFNQFGFTIEYGKSEVFHFSRSTKNFNSLPLDLSPLEDSKLQLKNMWKYLGFHFNNMFGIIPTKPFQPLEA